MTVFFSRQMPYGCHKFSFSLSGIFFLELLRYKTIETHALTFCHVIFHLQLVWLYFILTQNISHFFKQKKLLIYWIIFYLFRVKKGHITFGQKIEIPIIVVQLPVETGLQNHDSLTRKSVIGHHFKVHIVAKVFLKLKCYSKL